MYGLLVTFETKIPLADLAEPFTDYANALNNVAGLLTKTWLNDGDTVGGFHLFADKQAAESYLQSELAQGLMATDGFDAFESRGFEVLEELSAMTGIGALSTLATTAG